MGALVYHQIIRFGEASLAKFAHKFTLWPHFTTEIRPTVVIIDSHYRKHFCRFWVLAISTRDSRALFLSVSLTSSSTGALNLRLKCVLNGLLTWCSCNPPFRSLYGNFLLILSLLDRETLIRWRSCHGNKFTRNENIWNKRKKKRAQIVRKRRQSCVCFYLNCFKLSFISFSAPKNVPKRKEEQREETTSACQTTNERRYQFDIIKALGGRW